METQKIINLLNDSNNEELKFLKGDTIKFETEAIKSSLVLMHLS